MSVEQFGVRQAYLKRLEKTIDKLAQVVSVDEWENEKKFMERSGIKSRSTLSRWRKDNPGAWRVDNRGRYIYSKLAGSKPLKAMKNI